MNSNFNNIFFWSIHKNVISKKLIYPTSNIPTVFYRIGFDTFSQSFRGVSCNNSKCLLCHMSKWCKLKEKRWKVSEKKCVKCLKLTWSSNQQYIYLNVTFSMSNFCLGCWKSLGQLASYCIPNAANTCISHHFNDIIMHPFIIIFSFEWNGK